MSSPKPASGKSPFWWKRVGDTQWDKTSKMKWHFCTWIHHSIPELTFF